MQYNKFLSMLANYDCLSLLKDDWPHFKFLLENSYFVSNVSGSNIPKLLIIVQ